MNQLKTTFSSFIINVNIHSILSPNNYHIEEKLTKLPLNYSPINDFIFINDKDKIVFISKGNLYIYSTKEKKTSKIDIIKSEHLKLFKNGSDNIFLIDKNFDIYKIDVDKEKIVNLKSSEEILKNINSLPSIEDIICSNSIYIIVNKNIFEYDTINNVVYPRFNGFNFGKVVSLVVEKFNNLKFIAFKDNSQNIINIAYIDEKENKIKIFYKTSLNNFVSFLESKGIIFVFEKDKYLTFPINKIAN
ncbi:hypothetical protein [Thermosipho melanesiensis]|uniref:hypothetical protein n=1 Tax=Thermosipho melanesiensis TaxID=46541 RepID=UPI0003154E53|nr:hypothetical protein [Thermosipho melanesiensis]